MKKEAFVWPVGLLLTLCRINKINERAPEINTIASKTSCVIKALINHPPIIICIIVPYFTQDGISECWQAAWMQKEL